MCTFKEAIRRYFNKAFNFEDRACRAEFWWIVLFNALIGFAIGFVFRDYYKAVVGLYNLITLIPSLALAIRRLHDTNKSGWFILINLIPGVGQIAFIIIMLLTGDAGLNSYGPVPVFENKE